MSNLITASVSENFELTVASSDGYTGEHNAETLEINISPLLTNEYDYYVLVFDDLSVSGVMKSNEIRNAEDYPAYLDTETIICPLSSQLTSTGRLKVQLEAHKITESGSIIKKTSVASIEFRPSIMSGSEMSFDSVSLSRLDDIEKRLLAAEKIIAASSGIQLATTDSIGGMKLLSSSPVQLDENGAAIWDVSKINELHFAVKTIMTFLYNSTRAKCIYQKTCEEDTRTLLVSVSKVISGSYNYVLFYSETDGTISYRDASGNITDLNAKSNILYLFSGKNTDFAVKEYNRNSFRELLVEGVA